MPEGMIVIRYLDHVLFRGVDHREQRPIVRETVGWLVRQSEDAVWLLWDSDASKVKTLGFILSHISDSSAIALIALTCQGRSVPVT